MKNIKLCLIGQTVIYSPQVPEVSPFQNRNVNAPGSRYAQIYGHQVTTAVQRIVRKIIYDAAPQQYFDLKILGMMAPKMINSDEWFYHEMTFGRDPIILGVVAVGQFPGGLTQYNNVPIANINAIANDMILVFPDNSRATTSNVNAGAGTCTLTAPTNATLSAIAAGPQGTTVFANLAPVEADGANAISQYYRIETVERSNFIQMFVKAQRWGKMEWEKYRRAGTLDNFLAMQKKRMQDQFRIDLSNSYWNGAQGEVTLANGQVAKTTGGIYPSMVNAGSANTQVSLSNLPQALEELALDTEFKVYGAKRFLYGANRSIHYLCQQYKRSLTRYAPNDEIAKLELKMIDIGSTQIVLVPIKRFEEPSCFPASWRSRLILVDQASIQPCYFLPEEFGETLARVNQGTLQNFTDTWMTATFGIEFYNPLGCGWIDITDLP